MEIDCDVLLDEVRELWPACDGIRNNNGTIEFALKTTRNELEWFPYYQAPIQVERYIDALTKFDS